MEWRDSDSTTAAASAATSRPPLLRRIRPPTTSQQASSPLLPTPSGYVGYDDDDDDVMREDPSPWMPVLAPTDQSILDVLSGAATSPQTVSPTKSIASIPSTSPPVTGSTPTQYSLSDSVFCLEETPKKTEVIFIFTVSFSVS